MQSLFCKNRSCSQTDYSSFFFLILSISKIEILIYYRQMQTVVKWKIPDHNTVTGNNGKNAYVFFLLANESYSFHNCQSVPTLLIIAAIKDSQAIIDTTSEYL